MSNVDTVSNMTTCSSSSVIVDKYHVGATRTLVISNLKQNTKVDGLKKTFEIFGEIIKIDFNKSIDFNTSDKTTEKCAIIEYADILSAEKAILTMDKEILEGNYINLSFGKTKATNCVWVDGISERVSEKYLKLFFEQFGFVTNSEIDRLRQQALVFFQTITEAQSAISHLHGTIFKGNRLQLDFASILSQQEFYEHLEEIFRKPKSHQFVANDDDVYSSNNSLAVDFDKNNCGKTSSTCINCCDSSSRSYDMINNSLSKTNQAENYFYINHSEKQQHLSFKTLQLNESSNLGHLKNNYDFLSPPDSDSNDSQSCNDAQLYNDEKSLSKLLKMFNEKYELWEQSRTKIKNPSSNTQSQTMYNYFDKFLNPSNILEKLLIKPSVFTDDAKRLEHVLSDSYITKTPISFQGIEEDLVSPPLLDSSRNGSLKHPSASFLSTYKINCSFSSQPSSTKNSQHSSSTNSQLPSKNLRLGIDPKAIPFDYQLPPHLKKPFFTWKDNSEMNEKANKNKPEKKMFNNDERFEYVNQWIANSFSCQTYSNFKKEEDNNNKNKKFEKILDIFYVKEGSKDSTVGFSESLTKVQENHNSIISQILKEHTKYIEKNKYQSVTDSNVNFENTTKPVSYKPIYENAIRKNKSSEQSLKRKISDSANNLKVNKIMKMNDTTLGYKNSLENNKCEIHTFAQKKKKKKEVPPSKIKSEDSCTKDEDKNTNQYEANITYNVSMYDKVKARSASKMLI